MSQRNTITLDADGNKVSVAKHKCRLCDPALGDIRFKKQRLLQAHRRQVHHNLAR